MKSPIVRYLSFPFLLIAFVAASSAQQTWEPVPAFSGGSVQAIHVVDATTVLAGTVWGGVYRSTNGGRDWSFAGLAAQVVHQFITLPGNRILAASSGGVFESADGGKSWSLLDLGVSGGINALALTPGGTLYAGGGPDLFRSGDGGVSWEPVDVGIEGARVLSMLAADGGLYLGTNSHGLLRSTDGGDSWHAVDTLLNETYIVALGYSGGAIFVPTWAKSIYRSTDGGATWTDVGSGLTRPRVNTFFTCGNGELLVGLYAGGALRSTNLGDSWEELPALPGEVGIGAFGELHGGTLLCGLEGQAVLRSTDDGASWTASATGLTAMRIDDMLLDTDGALHVTPFYLAWQKSTDRGETWIAVDDVRPAGKRIAIGSNGYLYSAREYIGVFHSEDNGATWIPHQQGLDRPQFRSFVVADDGHMFVILRDGTCRHLPPGSEAWQRIGEPLASRNLRELFSADGLLCASTNDDGLYWSSDNGGSWAKRNEEQFGINCLASIGGALYAGTGGAVHRSDDGGVTWPRLGHETEAVVTSVAMSPEGTLYVSTTARGILRLDAHTDEWHEENEGLPPAIVDEMAIDGGGAMFARISWHGLFRRGAAPVRIEADLPLPERVTLHANAPNPFRPSTAIRFTLPRPMAVTLIVTDLLGREVARPQPQADLQAGTQVRSFDAAGLASGVYICRLCTVDGVLMRKMLLTR